MPTGNAITMAAKGKSLGSVAVLLRVTKMQLKQPQNNPKITPKQPLMIMIMIMIIIIKKVLKYQRKTSFLCPILPSPRSSSSSMNGYNRIAPIC